jgi:hypothetical protein
MPEYRVTVTTNDEEYVYHVLSSIVDDPEDAEDIATEEAVASAIWDGMDQTDYYFTRIEEL